MATPPNSGGTSAERSSDFLVDEHATQLINYVKSSAKCCISSSMDIVLRDTPTTKRSSSRVNKKGHNIKNAFGGENGSKMKALLKQLPEEFQCDPCLSCIVSQTNVMEGTTKIASKQGNKGDKPPPAQNKTETDVSNKKKEVKARNLPEKLPLGEATNTKTAGKAKKISETPPHLQCDPCFVGIMAARNNPVPSKTKILKKASLFFLPNKPKSKPKESASPPYCSTLEQPTTYLDVEPLICQLVPKGVADVINEELEIAKTPLKERKSTQAIYQTPPSEVEPGNNGKDAGKDWQALPKNLMGKVAFFERLMKQNDEKPSVDATVKVKTGVSEKVKSAHDQVRTSLLATKATNGIGVVLPDDLTPLAKKKERVQTFFPKDENTVPKMPAPKATKTTTSQWAKVETTRPSTFHPAQQQSPPTSEELPVSLETRVEDMVHAMEKNLDDALTSLDNEMNTLDNKLNDLDSKSAGGNFDKSSSTAVQDPETVTSNGRAVRKDSVDENDENIQNKESQEEEVDPYKCEVPYGTPVESPKIPARETPDAETNNEGGETDGKAVDTVAKTGNLAPEGLKVVAAAEEAREAEEIVDQAEKSEDLAATEAPKTGTTMVPTETAGTEETIDPLEKLEDQSIETKTTIREAEVPTVTPASAEASKPNTFTEELHGESLSRDLAAEVLEESEEAEESPTFPSLVASLSVDEFPSLGPSTPKRSPARTPLKKSYAQVLAEGKKLEQTKIDLSKFLPPPSSPLPAAVAKASFPTISKTKTSDNAALKSDDAVARGSLGSSAVRGQDENMVRTRLENDATDQDASTTDHAGKISVSIDKSVIEDSNVQVNTERAKMEEIAQLLAEATPQKKFQSSVVEEHKSEPPMDPGFTEITRRKKTTEDETDLARTSEQNLLSTAGDQNVVPVIPPSSTLSKANFNPYSALTDLADRAASTSRSVYAKSINQKSLPHPPSLKKKKAVHFGTKEKSAKGGKHKSQESLSRGKRSPSLLVMPVHLLNNLIHRRPLSYVVDGIFWAIFLLLGGPLAAVGVVVLAVYRLLSFIGRLFGFGIIKPKKNPGKQLAVVVTGCDSGFGHDLAQLLLEEGFVVFCGCLRKDSMKNFEQIENAIPLVMDVTKDGDVDKAAKAVLSWLSEDSERYLHALVNNAGVGTVGLIDWMPTSEFEKMIEVNFYGMVRCCKKFLPLFKSQASDGTYSDARIVNMVSVAGLVSGGLFSVGYEASKHAAEVFTTNLRLEVKGWGLKVSVINPSFHKTPMTKSIGVNMKKTWKALSPEKRKQYGEEYIERVCAAGNVAQNVVNWDSRNVVDAMHKSLVYKNPPARTIVGSDARYLLILIKMLPAWFMAMLMRQKPPAVPAMMSNES